MRRRLLATALCLVAGAALSGCSATAEQGDGAAPAKPLAFAASPAAERPSLVQSGGLAGRTLTIRRIEDIRLKPREVVLTFDDGPMPGKTEAILRALDNKGVRATFLMVGQMAKAYPAIARKVAAAGHTIGTHTENHRNLAQMSTAAAEVQIAAGRRSVATALMPTGYRPAPFFRFPYLADTHTLRRHLAQQGTVVIDVDIDSKDYFQSSPDQLRRRVVERVQARGSGIILMHDIHARTVAMLPGLLDELHRKGFKVVHLRPAAGSTGDQMLLSRNGAGRTVAYAVPSGR